MSGVILHFKNFIAQGVNTVVKVGEIIYNYKFMRLLKVTKEPCREFDGCSR